MNSSDVNSICEQKKVLRKEIRRLKSLADVKTMQEESVDIFGQIEALDQFRAAKTVLAYWSMPDEVSTHDFVKKWHVEKRILLPLVMGDNLELRVFTGMDCMVVGPSFGILEPRNGLPYDNEPIDFAVIPGVAFDLAGNRLGRGKGYYDKLLKQQTTYKVGVAFRFQVVPSVPVDRFDIPMDLIVQSHK